MNKKKIFIFTVGLIAGVFFSIIGIYNNRPRTIQVNINEALPSPVQIFRGTDFDEHGNATNYTGSPVVSFVDSMEIKLPRGTYVAFRDKDERYKSVYKSFIVKDGGDLDINVQTTESYLDARLVSERFNIEQVFFETLSPPINRSDYQIIETSVFGNGTYAGVIFTRQPLDDYVRVVLIETNNQWRVVTQPALILSKLDYPDIPRDIINQVNSKLYEETGFRQ